MSKRKTPEDPVTGPKLWVVLARAHGALATFVESSVVAAGLCLSDFMVLELLLHKGSMPISAIGERVLLANASMTSAIDRLEKRGLVLRRNAEHDRRIRIVKLTGAGRRFIAALYARHAAEIKEVVSILTHAEQEQLRTLLKKLGYAARAACEAAAV